MWTCSVPVATISDIIREETQFTVYVGSMSIYDAFLWEQTLAVVSVPRICGRSFLDAGLPLSRGEAFWTGLNIFIFHKADALESFWGGHHWGFSNLLWLVSWLF